MTSLPPRPDIDHLRRQAKKLLAAFRRGAPDAVARLCDALPAAAGREAAAVARMPIRLHDAQSCLAREHGFASWSELKAYVEASRASAAGNVADAFCRLAYAGDLAGGTDRARPHAAARLLADHPDLPARDPWIACAVGDVARVRRQIEADPAWVNRTGGPLVLTPLVAATHSSLLGLAGHREGLHATVDLLLSRGADPNLRVERRWQGLAGTPAQDWQASPLHGAAGVNHDPALTRRLLAAGADPNDGESLYHSLDDPACTPLLIEAGAVVAGTNALFRCLDFDDVETFRLLLAQARGSTEVTDGRLLLWAIRRRRSAAHVEALIAAGADPAVRTRDGASAHTHALRYGLVEVAAMLQRAGSPATAGDEDALVAACAREDADAARRILARRPDLPAALGKARLAMLPELAAAGCSGAVALMVELGWPVDVPGGDWAASALNHAVFRGDAAMARRLLEAGATWSAPHGHGDDVCGTLSWASWNRPTPGGDWGACADALVAHGLPVAAPDDGDPESVIVAGRRRRFPEDVAARLLEAAGPKEEVLPASP